MQYAQRFCSLKIKISQFPNGFQLTGNQHNELANLRFSFLLIAFYSLNSINNLGIFFNVIHPIKAGRKPRVKMIDLLVT